MLRSAEATATREAEHAALNMTRFFMHVLQGRQVLCDSKHIPVLFDVNHLTIDALLQCSVSTVLIPASSLTHV